ncbi:MAG: NAD+ synthase [Methylacidiphilales bacterium]|nr:NAD+ synthase [Candidatus Methylacidiphilales bacterium]
MKIACLQLNATVGDFEGNLQKVREAYQKAVLKEVDLVLAPELFLTGYPPRDLLVHEDFLRANDVTNAKLASWVGEVPLICGILTRNETRPGKPLRNSGAFFQEGEIRHLIHKCLLPTYDVFDEDRYFEPGTACIPFEWNGKKIGITICEDIWNDADFWRERLYQVDPVRELAGKGIDLLVNISASPWTQNKEMLRYAMLQKVAETEKLPLVQVNVVGGNDELIFDGHSMAFNSKGRLIARGRSFEEQILVLDTEGEECDPAWPCEEELLFSALSLGTRDYVRKCGFGKVAIGLSGGIDSALTTVIAVEALGPDNVLGVLMPGRYSSQGSITDAEALAKILEIEWKTLRIDDSYQALLKQLGPFVQESDGPDLTLENLQARIRGVTLMAISNKTGRLVLTTGNKSELASGYCTLYGDMCGSLGVLSDVSKTQVYQLARWINRHQEIIPRSSIEKAPSAELRPHQTDQDSLPPYEILDGILDLYVLKGRTVSQIMAAGFEENVVRDLIKKFDQNEYKRRQAAPGLKVTTKAFGIGRRMPIAQGFRHP